MLAPLKVLCYRVLEKAGYARRVPSYFVIETSDGKQITLYERRCDTIFVGSRKIYETPCPMCRKWFGEKIDHFHKYEHVFYAGWVIRWEFIKPNNK